MSLGELTVNSRLRTVRQSVSQSCCLQGRGPQAWCSTGCSLPAGVQCLGDLDLCEKEQILSERTVLQGG